MAPTPARLWRSWPARLTAVAALVVGAGAFGALLGLLVGEPQPPDLLLGRSRPASRRTGLSPELGQSFTPVRGGLGLRGQ
ncbi:hypothetical protein ACFQ08_45000, partial [Streptosporangium algeriense]